jgi:hypothetical protein
MILHLETINIIVSDLLKDNSSQENAQEIEKFLKKVIVRFNDIRLWNTIRKEIEKIRSNYFNRCYEQSAR